MAVRLVKSKQTRLKHQSEFHFGCWICLVLNISGPGGAWSRRTVSKRRLFVFFWLCVLTQCWLSNGCQWRSLSVFQFSNQQLARWELCLAWIRCFAGGRALQEPPREFVIPNTWVMDAKAFKASIEFPSRFLFWCLSRPIHHIICWWGQRWRHERHAGHDLPLTWRSRCFSSSWAEWSKSNEP